MVSFQYLEEIIAEVEVFSSLLGFKKTREPECRPPNEKDILQGTPESTA